jgi:arylsulfatase A-like enzyme
MKAIGATRAKITSVILASTLTAVWGVTQIGDARHNAATAAVGKPNILFIILDDVGVDQLKLFGFGGALPAHLPNLAQIAQKGVKFTNVWSMPECSPTRAAFFTGQYPVRSGSTAAIVPNHLPQEYVSSYAATLPRVLAKAGYISALVGKYHLGEAKDPAALCAPLSRGWHVFRGALGASPPPIDRTAGGGDPSGAQTCGYFQTSAEGACYTQKDGATNCTQITAGNADTNTTPSRTCLQNGGLFRPNTVCGASVPTADDFARYNAHYVWPRFQGGGPRLPHWVDKDGDACGPRTVRGYSTEVQSNDGVRWWNQQSGPRMLTVSYNVMHTEFQKAPTDIVPDPTDFPTDCDSVSLGNRPLLNNMLKGLDVEIGRMLADMGLGTLQPDGRRLATLDLRDTIVVIVGDNGSFGGTVRIEDGFDAVRSKTTVYQTGVWVPLIIAGGMVNQPGRDVEELINVTDLFQFFGDVAGLNVKEVVPPSHILDSKPLLPYLQSSLTPAIRETNFTQSAAGKFTPVPEERSWPCKIGRVCNDTLLYNKGLCHENNGTWYGPEPDPGVQQQTSCCAVAATNRNVSLSPVAQWAVRNKRYKLVELLQTNCAAPLPPNATNKPFPWAEYETKSKQEFYDLTPTSENPVGLDQPEGNYLKDCPDGKEPRSCLPLPLRPVYTKLARVLNETRNSGEPQHTCRSLGDGNLDLRVNDADIRAFNKFKGFGPSQYDINMDGQTDDADLAIIQANLGVDCMNLCERADLNRSGKVDSRDMEILVKQSGRCDEVLCGGDLDGNGTVDNRDVRLMLDAQNTCNAPASTKPKSASVR